MAIMQDLFINKSDTSGVELRDAFDALRTRFDLLTEFASIPSRGVTWSKDYPSGYLSAQRGSHTLVIPWLMADTLPDDEVLADFCHIADHVRVGGASTLCLSGTSARCGLFSEIGDVDFSEYVFDDAAVLSRRFKALLSSTSKVCLPVEAKIFSPNTAEKVHASCPLPDPVEEGSQHQAFLLRCGDTQSKLDFLGHMDRYGLIPITNMVLPGQICDRKQGTHLRSFSFQEVVIASAEWTSTSLWPLLDVYEIAHYLRFLIRDTQHYLHANPLKALKRATALSRMLEIHALDEELVDLVRSPGVTALTRSARRSEAKIMAEKIESRVLNAAFNMTELINENPVMVASEKTESESYEACRAVVAKVLKLVKDDLNNFDPALADYLMAA